ncbi:MAG TPA: class I SAM-dependent methyltransferase [Gaiellaceae bacterium]|jgi:SAM-dependent methyltransferase
MTRSFCTLFDVNYLPRGLVMWRSLRTVLPDSRLWVLCMDAATKDFLDGAAEPGLEPIALSKLEDHDRRLAATKPMRTRAEYCWTSTPALCRYVLERNPTLDAITYLDADLMFWSSPGPLFDSLGANSIQIVPHRYAPQWARQEATHGVYNVEWVTFRRDERGLAALFWWYERCLEWCYATPEGGRFGDQKYLDDWPERFEGVDVVPHPGAGLAPWNAPRHRLEPHGDSVTVDGEPLIFFHFHSLALHEADVRARTLAALNLPLGPRLDEGIAWTSNYPIGDIDRAWIWRPYIRRLRTAHRETYVREVTSLPLRKILAPLAGAARRRMHAAKETVPSRRALRNGRSSLEDWDHGQAPEMLKLVRTQLEAPDIVPPFRGFRYALERVLADGRRERPLRLLDIGCGVGHYSELVGRWFDRDVVYFGSDASAEMVAIAEETWPGRSFTQDDVLKSTLDYGSYDVLLAGALVDVLAEWRPAVDALLGSSAPYVILHRQRLARGATRVRRASGYAGGETFRTALSEADLFAAVARHGRTLVLRLPIEPGVETFVFRRAAG